MAIWGKTSRPLQLTFTKASLADSLWARQLFFPVVEEERVTSPKSVCEAGSKKDCYLREQISAKVKEAKYY